MDSFIFTTNQPTDEEYQAAKEYLKNPNPEDSQWDESIDILARKLGIIYLRTEMTKYEDIGQAVYNATTNGFKQIHSLEHGILATNPNPNQEDLKLLLEACTGDGNQNIQTIWIYDHYEQNQDHPELNDHATWSVHLVDGKHLLQVIVDNTFCYKCEVTAEGDTPEEIQKKIQDAEHQFPTSEPEWPSFWLGPQAADDEITLDWVLGELGLTRVGPIQVK